MARTSPKSNTKTCIENYKHEDTDWDQEISRHTWLVTSGLGTVNSYFQLLESNIEVHTEELVAK